MLQYDFMKNALWAILLITPLFGLIGTMVVNNKLAFFSDALGHSALTGIAVGVLLGISNPMVSMSLFAILFAFLLNNIKRSKVSSGDTIISVFSSTALALGLVILSLSGSFSKYSSYLIGDILTIVSEELVYLTILFVGVLIFWLCCFNQLLAVSTNISLAKSRGIPTNLIETLFVMILAMLVTVSIKWVGILIINSLLILPAAAARNIAKNMRQYHFLSVVFSLFSGVCGLIISFYAGLATGPTIVLISAAIFFTTFLFRRKL